MMDENIQYQILETEPRFSHFVERIWMLANPPGNPKQLMVLPDGRLDILFSRSASGSFHAVLLGLETAPSEITLEPGTVAYGISFKLLAVEYLIGQHISNILNSAQRLPENFWDITATDLHDFDLFFKKISLKIEQNIQPGVDERKRTLFRFIYESNGSLTVRELADKVHWSSRQINRYFNKQFGISLKSYCSILRFRASFGHLKEGKLYPEQNFSDQAHFIRDVKKFSGVVPKELAKNQNDRFVQFSP